MTQLPTSELLSRYMNAAKEGSPDADKLREEWKLEVEEQLQTIISQVSKAKASLLQSKQGKQSHTYKELIYLYRLSMNIAADISNVKKTMREEK